MKEDAGSAFLVVVLLVVVLLLGVLLLEQGHSNSSFSSGEYFTATPTVTASQCQPEPQATATGNQSAANSQLFYRAGNSLTLQGNEGTQLDASGNIQVSRVRGPSFNTLRTKLPLDKAAQLGVYSLKASDLPKGLHFQQQGKEPTHFELVPDCDMPLTQYLALLYKVTQAFKYEP